MIEIVIMSEAKNLNRTKGDPSLALRMTKTRVLYMNKSLRDEKPWVLKRQDDNGHVEEMEYFADKDEAERERDKFEKRAHKQTYFVEKRKPKTP